MVQLSKAELVFDPTAPVRATLVSFEASKILPCDAFMVAHEVFPESAVIVVPSDTIAPFRITPLNENAPFKTARYQSTPRKPSPLREVSNYVPVSAKARNRKRKESAIDKTRLQQLNVSVLAKWKATRVVRPRSYMPKGKIRLDEYEGGYRAGIIKATKGLGDVSRKARASGRAHVPERPTWF